MTVFGEAVDYCDLQTLLRQRAQALRLTMESIDKTAGFADALASHILQPFPIKSALGPQTLGPLLTVLGLKIAVCAGIRSGRSSGRAWRGGTGRRAGSRICSSRRKSSAGLPSASVASRRHSSTTGGDRHYEQTHIEKAHPP